MRISSGINWGLLILSIVLATVVYMALKNDTPNNGTHISDNETKGSILKFR